MSENTIRPVPDPEPYSVLECSLGAGRHRAPTVIGMRPRRARRLARWAIAVAAVVLVLTLGALWASQRAHAEAFVECPSGLTGVATTDTSCAFADSVRAAFYWQPQWTIYAKSPVTGKFYTMQCVRTLTDNGWRDPKRCFGLSDGGDPLVVYVA